MNYVDAAFDKMRQSGEITTTEQNLAQRRHKRIRETLEALWEIDKTFLTGSYDRHTKIKPLEDVDIFAIIKAGGAQAHFRDEAPSNIVNALSSDLTGKFKHVEPSGMAVRISLSDDDGQASFELVPAFTHPSTGYDAPDPQRGRWIRTDPNVHAQLTTTKNQVCAGRWVPFVKMLKGWNRQAGKPIPQSFLVEVMALELVHPPFGRDQDEMTAIFGNMADRSAGPWPDPASLGPDVDELLSPFERDVMRRAATEALAVAEEAIYLEDVGQERKAVNKWRELFRRSDAAALIDPAAATELYRAYSHSYATEANRRRIAFYVDLAFAAVALALTAITLADAAEPLVDFLNTWLPIAALLWLGLREINPVAADKRHRREAVNIQEQFDLCFWKGTNWAQHWNRLLAGEPVPDRTIKQLAAKSDAAAFDSGYWVDTQGLPDNDAALFRIEQTAAWGAVGHRRYVRLNRGPALAGIIAICSAALILDLTARHAAVMLLAVAPFLVGRIQSARDHDTLAERRERLERHVQAMLDPKLPRSDTEVREAQDEVYRMRIEHRRIPTWLYNRYAVADRQAIDAALAARVSTYAAGM